MIIPLTKGKKTIIDDSDYPLVSQHTWHTIKGVNTWYAASRVKGQFIYLHRFLLSPEEGMTVDHKNGNGLDNRRENIRIATHSQQGANRVKSCKKYSTPFKGIYKRSHCNGYYTMIEKLGKLHCASFKKIEDAIEWYQNKSKELFGEFVVQRYL